MGGEGGVEELMSFGDVSNSDEGVGFGEVTSLDFGGFEDLSTSEKKRTGGKVE